MADDAVLPLAGFTIAVTADRRREELTRLLERRGAQVVGTPAIRIVPLPDDGELLAATRDSLSAPLDFVVATTGIGFRGWLEAADEWGLADKLVHHLSTARIVTRGPKARGAVRAAGLEDAWSPASESSAEVLDHLLEGRLTGCRVVVQLHGEPQPEFCDALRAAGAMVIEVPVYRWVVADDDGALSRLVEMAIGRQLDAITYTSAPAVLSMLRVAAPLGLEQAFVHALKNDVVPICVGPVCAAPFVELGVESVVPDRARLGALVRAAVDEVPARRAVTAEIGGQILQVRGHAATFAGRLVPLAPGPLAVLKALAREPGRVLSRRELITMLPGDGDEHAVEMTVARLRGAFGEMQVIETVVKRGYRLATGVGVSEPD